VPVTGAVASRGCSPALADSKRAVCRTFTAVSPAAPARQMRPHIAPPIYDSVRLQSRQLAGRSPLLSSARASRRLPPPARSATGMGERSGQIIAAPAGAQPCAGASFFATALSSPTKTHLQQRLQAGSVASALGCHPALPPCRCSAGREDVRGERRVAGIAARLDAAATANSSFSHLSSASSSMGLLTQPCAALHPLQLCWMLRRCSRG